jgi:hypothetical protein
MHTYIQHAIIISCCNAYHEDSYVNVQFMQQFRHLHVFITNHRPLI